MKIVSLAQLSGVVQIEGDYSVEINGHSHFIIVSMGLYPQASSRFSHPNVAAWQDDTFETRAYWPSGRKKWFSHAGRAYYFVVPRERIGLIYEKGCSYVPVEINGCQFVFNVSGGTQDGGWRDWVGQKVHVQANLPIKKLNLLAEAALPVDEARAVVSMDLMEISPDNSKTFTDIVTSQVCKTNLREGHQIVPRVGCSWPQQPNKFILDRRTGRRQYFLCRGHETNKMLVYRVPFTDVDWLLTAQANQFKFQMPEHDNQIGPIVPYHDPYRQAS